MSSFRVPGTRKLGGNRRHRGGTESECLFEGDAESTKLREMLRENRGSGRRKNVDRTTRTGGGFEASGGANYRGNVHRIGKGTRLGQLRKLDTPWQAGCRRGRTRYIIAHRLNGVTDVGVGHLVSRSKQKKRDGENSTFRNSQALEIKDLLGGSS